MGHHDRFEYLHELEKVLQTHNAKFIWAHRGASRRVIHKNYAKKVKEMLNRYNNIYVNISWIVYADIVCKDQEPKKSWVDLIKGHSDGFVIGSDLCGCFEKL